MRGYSPGEETFLRGIVRGLGEKRQSPQGIFDKIFWNSQNMFGRKKFLGKIFEGFLEILGAGGSFGGGVWENIWAKMSNVFGRRGGVLKWGRQELRKCGPAWRVKF